VRSAFAAFSLALALFCVTATGASAFSLDSYPFQQQGEPLTSPDVAELAEQGYSVALSANGDTALVGSPDYKESTSEEFAGAAWVYIRSGSTWTFEQKLVGSEGSGDAQQGHSVALSANGETALIGGPEDEGEHEDYYGAAWVFRRNGGKWEQVGKKLVAGGTGASTKAKQGSSVSLSANGETALIGAEDNEEGGKSGVGAAFVFRWNGSEFKQQGGPLIGHHGTQIGLQGWSVALAGDGETALIGGPKSEGEKGEREAGGSWVFTWDGSEWKEQAKLPQGTGAGLETGLGESVALSGDGDTALVGGIGYASGIGAAWVYVRNGEKWEEQGPPLQGNDAGTREADLEGHGVALSEDGDTALVGGPGDDVSRGATWAFERSGSTWSEQQKLEGTGGEGFAEQGFGVALSADGSTALVGAPGEKGGEGAAWVFFRALSSEPETKSEAEQEHKTSTNNNNGSQQPPGASGTAAFTAASTAGIATTPQAVEELLLGCSKRSLVLNDVVIHGSRVKLEGSAAKSLDGKRVKIVFDGDQRVATALVAANGQFSTTAPLPPASLRDGNDARYQAESGSQRSLDLKLTRRLTLEPPEVSGHTVTLVGQVLAPLTEPVAAIAVQQELECGKTSVVERVKPSANGRFHITLTVPSAAKAGIYRLTSTVRENTHSKQGFATYSLPLPAVLG
jgi:FG-GAP repeat